MMSLLLSQLPLMDTGVRTQSVHFVPKYMREAIRMAVGNLQWDSLELVGEGLVSCSGRVFVCLFV